jgi:hypothetical protein
LAEGADCAIKAGMAKPETKLTVRMRSAVKARRVFRFMGILGGGFEGKSNSAKSLADSSGRFTKNEKQPLQIIY